jgi:hypothetical protein
VDKVKASDGIDVANLSTEDVHGFVSLVVRRLGQSTVGEVGAT